MMRQLEIGVDNAARPLCVILCEYASLEEKYFKENLLFMRNRKKKLQGSRVRTARHACAMMPYGLI